MIISISPAQAPRSSSLVSSSPSKATRRMSGMNTGAREWKPNTSAAVWQPSWLGEGGTKNEITQESTNQATQQDESVENVETGISNVSIQQSNVSDETQQSDENQQPLFEQAAEEESSATAIDDKANVTSTPELKPSQPPNAPQETEQAQAAPAQAVDTHVDTAAVEQEYREALTNTGNADPRDHLNIVFIGHVDAGKSTLCGSIMYSLGAVDKRTIEKFEAEAKERNRESWFLAYIMDTNEEERAKGKTVEVGRAYLETEARRFTVLDAPGHKNYVPAMIAGASQADVGILVISARKGEFEAGFDRQGQTREHAMLAKTLGVQKLVVVINKMDEPTVKWSKDRYDSIVKRLTPYLKGCGYRVKRDVSFIPISALSSLNVKEALPKGIAAWAETMNDGKSLIQTLETLTITGRDETAPLRLTIIDRYVDRGTVLMAKVETGIIFKGQTVLVCPNQQQYKVDTIYINEVEVDAAKPGENILLRLGGLSENEVSKGHVIASRFAPVAGCTEIIGEMFVTELLEHRPLLSAGYNAVFHAHTADEECTVKDLVALIDPKTGKISQKNPPFGKEGQKIIVRIKLMKSLCLEEYSKMMQLGRFTLRDEGKTVAIGIIKKCR